MFEFIAILFVILGIVSRVLQADQKRKQTGTGLPPPLQSETRQIAIDAVNNTSPSKKAVRKAANKSPTTKPVEKSLDWVKDNPVIKPLPAQVKVDTDTQHEISLDRDSVLNGVIFSVILSPPKCKGMGSFP